MRLIHGYSCNQAPPPHSQPRPNLPPGISVNNRPRLPPGIQVQRTSSPPALQRSGAQQHQQQMSQAQRVPNLPSSIQIQREPAGSNPAQSKSVPRLPAGISISQGGASENKLPKSVSISRTPSATNNSAGDNSNSMNRLSKLGGISVVGSGDGGSGSNPTGLTITKNGTNESTSSSNKPNPLARLSHLNVSISGGNKNGTASPPATPPTPNSSTPPGISLNLLIEPRDILHFISLSRGHCSQTQRF